MSAAVPSAPPTREHHPPAAVLAAGAVALLVLLPVLLDERGRLATVLVLQVALVLAWVAGTGLRSSPGAVAVGAAGAIAADLALVLPRRPTLGALVAVLGTGFLAVVLQQMFRRSRSALVESLSGALLLLSAVGALAVLLLVDRPGTGAMSAVPALMAVVAALVVGHAADLVAPRPRLVEGVPRGLTGLALAIPAGAVAAVVSRGETLSPTAALVAGAALGALAALAAVVAGFVVADPEVAPSADPGSLRRAQPVLQAVLPVAVCAPAVLALTTAL